MDLLQALSDWPVAAALRQSAIAYPLVNAAHILSLGLLWGAIATLDLRILGLFRSHPLQHLGPPLSQAAACGLALAVVTGVLLFSTRPVTYWENPAFRIKLGLIGLGLLNLLLLHLQAGWRRALRGEGVAGSVKVSALASLLLWTGSAVAGRWIGFLQ